MVFIRTTTELPKIRLEEGEVPIKSLVGYSLRFEFILKAGCSSSNAVFLRITASNNPSRKGPELNSLARAAGCG